MKEERVQVPQPFGISDRGGQFFLTHQGDVYSGPFSKTFCEGMADSLNTAFFMGFTAGATDAIERMGGIAKAIVQA